MKYGTDVSDKTVFLYTPLHMIAYDPSATQDLKKLLIIQKIAEKVSLDLSINGADWTIIERNDTFKQYYKEHYEACLQEVQYMKDTKFYNHVSVFSIFMGSKKEVSGYARNDDLVKDLETQEDEFPIFFATLNKKFHTEVKKQRLRKNTAYVLSDVCKFNDPYVSTL